ncbi:polysaccharide deacetylase family protein [Haloferula chungangensis]|uniref:Polysaccharide deacetylase family protein n=1 Tax=Haloferula chungangensis TaxID=1048331 RepID=A0ABW2L4V1_9BACT
MIGETIKSGDNRAASPFFRVFGGRLKVADGDAVAMGKSVGNHSLEWAVLSTLVPGVVGVAVFDGLWRLGGCWAAWLGLLPMTFIALHVLGFLLGAWSPRGTFLVWSGALTAWALALLRWGGETPLVWVAWLWLGFIALQVLGMIGLVWQRMMRVEGPKGITLRIVLAVLIHLGIALIWWQFGAAWGASAFVGMVAVWALGTFNPTNEIFGPMPMRLDQRQALLTIDDGPDPEDTPVILDLLDKHGVKAVFFVIGDKVRRFPELAKEIVARGHELGNHTMTHPQHSMWSAGPVRMRREIEECSRVIEEMSGQRPRWFRAPVGHRNYFTHPIAAELGMEVVVWSRRGFDTLDREVEGIVDDLTRNLRYGEILLLHESTKQAPQVVKRVLEEVAPLKD